jgi:hypothetical protein
MATTITTMQLRLAIALILLRGVADRFKPELQLISLIVTAYIGNQYFNSMTEYGVCFWALFRKYRGLLGC